jgi:cell division protein YceG involved in septum cleavage
VLAPAAHHYHYFVAPGGRRHAVSETLERHLDGVEALRDREAAASP